MIIIELILNSVFFAFFLTLGIISKKVTKNIKEDLEKIDKSGGSVAIQGIDYKKNFEYNKNISLTSTVVSFVSASIFLYYFVNNILLLVFK